MRILIIEDKQVNIEKVKIALAEHNLTICSSYDEAEKRFTGAEHWYKEDAEFPYDVVLTDLFLPPSQEGVRNVDFAQEVPYGLIFALAAMRRGVPVAIVTDGSHHKHPINWALDLLGFDGMKKITIGTSIFCSSWTKDWKEALDKLVS